jgi:hypothetical protein
LQEDIPHISVCARAVRGVAAEHTEDNPKRLEKGVEDPKEGERLMSV